MWSQTASHQVKFQVKLEIKLVNTLEAKSMIQFSSNLVRIFVLTKCRSISRMGQVGSKCRSHGQIRGNACEHTRGHKYGSIFLKLGQNVSQTKYWSSIILVYVGP